MSRKKIKKGLYEYDLPEGIHQDVVSKPNRGKRKIKEKFIKERSSAVKPLVPLNKKQKDYIELINTKSMVIATGYAGTSKSFIPTVMACDALQLGAERGGVDKIVLSRPNISNSKSLGFMKGDLIEKFSYWLSPVLSIMKERLGSSSLMLHLEKGNIEFMPLEVVKGYSASDCFFIVDEAEDLSWDEAKKIITRQGKNCKLILAGDVSQSELKQNSGLKVLVNLVKNNLHLDAGLVDFNDFGDIVRSKQVREWIKVMVKEGI